ncbi:hypothetical protein J7L06_05725 [Candidatus Bathyarchaeota archaeon]|nr:hypothetical protein [Candidatus Bathyarchaeota archaeon]
MELSWSGTDVYKRLKRYFGILNHEEADELEKTVELRRTIKKRLKDVHEG